MEKIDKFFRKVPGGYFGLAGVAVVTVLFTISMSLFSITEKFNLFKHWVSHLGIGENGSAQVFSAALIVSGILFLPFVVCLFRQLWVSGGRGRGADAAGLGSALLSITGAVMAAHFNMGSSGEMHVISANLFFICATIFILFFTIAMVLTGRKVRWHLWVTGVSLALFAIFYPVVFYSAMELYFPGKANLTMADWIEFMTAMGPELNLVRFFEWLSLFGIFAWIGATSVYSIRLQKGGRGGSTHT
ncbi:MAG: DUF998 domain-containing protein [Promethearchaeota archaeon]